MTDVDFAICPSIQQTTVSTYQGCVADDEDGLAS